MPKYPFSAPGAAPPIGPYSPAVAISGFVFLSGQIPVDADGNVVGATAPEQARQAMDNLRGLVRNTGLSMSDVVKTTIFLTDMGDFAKVNEVYAKHIGNSRPARSTVAVAGLPKGVQVEIECVARVG